VDTSDTDQRPVDDGTPPVQSNKETIIHLVDLLSIATDAEFKHMFQYLIDGTLTDNDDQDRLTLLMADQYFIENGALYRLTAPRNKKQD